METDLTYNLKCDLRMAAYIVSLDKIVTLVCSGKSL